jgi:hypothetical protein
VSGTHWRIAIRAADWNAFNGQIPKDAHHRLRAAFDIFCSGDGDDLPEQTFHRVAGCQFGRLEEFVAFGVRVVGRRATDEMIQTFFVTEIRWALPAALPAASLPQPVQATLPLQINPAKKGTPS